MDEAVELANATNYSLAGAVWTKDVNSAMDVSMRIRAGLSLICVRRRHTECLLRQVA